MRGVQFDPYGGRFVAAGLVDILDGLLGSAERLVIAFVGVLAVVFVIMTWVRTKSFVPTLGAALLGGVVLFAVNNYAFLGNRVAEDIQKHNPGGEVPVSVPPRPPR